MKLKYVLLSGLFLSTAFVACTNDEFAEISTPANTENAIALGENYTISVAKAGAQTKSAFNDNLAPYWEKGDMLGAAWLHKVTEFDEETYEVIASSSIGSTYGDLLYSNHPFELTEGENTNNGKFKTVTNAFAGAYVLYYPYDPSVSMTKNSIPVKIKTYETDCKEGETLKAINENMFSYSPVKFVPGGNQTGEFTLNQVPVLFKLRFTATEKANMNLADGGVTIKNIVILAGDGTNNVLVSEGKIVAGTEPEEDNYNEVNDKDLSKIVKYEKVTTTDHLFITAKNSDNDDYKLLKEEVATKKQFIFSILPFSAEATEVTIKVVTDKGVYGTTFSGAADKKYIDEFNNAAEEGGQVSVNVKLDVTMEDDVIYTAEEFKARWKAACAAGEAETLEIGTPLELAEALTCNNVDANVTVKGHALTMPSMNLAKAANITFENELVVEGDVFTSGAVEFNAENLTAKNVEIQGDAALKVGKIEELTVASSGVIKSLSAVDAESEIGSIVVQKGNTSVGKIQALDATNLAIEELSSDGEITLASDMTNKGNMAIAKLDAKTYTFTNEGTVDLNGAFTGKFVNNAGATLNVNVTNAGMNLTNEKATDKAAAAIVNIAAGATLTAANTTSAAVANKGIINVYGNLTESKDGALTQTENAARINAMSKTAKITFARTNNTVLADGYVVIVDNANVANATGEPTAFNLTKATDFATAPASAATIFVNCDMKASVFGTNVSQNVVLYKNIAMDGSVTFAGNFIVAGAVKVNGTTTSQTLTITKNKTNVINKGASLTLSENVTMKGSANGTVLTNNGSFNKNGGTQSNITIQ